MKIRIFFFTLIFGFLVLELESQELLASKEVYNFKEGDIFHFNYNNDREGVIQKEKWKILDKVFDRDTVRYILKKTVLKPNRKLSQKHDTTVFSGKLDTLTKRYSFTNKSVIDLGNYDLTDPTPVRGVDTIINIHPSGRQLCGYSLTIGYGRNQKSYFYKWGQGLGMIYESTKYGGPRPITYKRELVYYKKELGQWGKPINVLKESDLIEKNIKIYPNPAAEKVKLAFNGFRQKRKTIVLFGSNGEKIFEKVSYSENVKFRLDGIEKGLYFFQIFQNGKMLKTQKLIINKQIDPRKIRKRN